MQDTDASTTCPHGLRPGTTVCLHCRADARAAARHRRNVLLARVGLLTLAGGVVIALVIGGVMAIAPGDTAEGADSTTTVVVSGSTLAPSSPSTPAAAAPAAEPGTLQPVIPEGRHDLVDSVFAVREGRQVTVHFDTETLRTRFDWKFEGVVRATLPLVYGRDARIAFDSIPEGTWVRGGALLVDLPERGIPLVMGTHRVRVWPITRAGRDGPLVVAYRAAIE